VLFVGLSVKINLRDPTGNLRASSFGILNNPRTIPVASVINALPSEAVLANDVFAGEQKAFTSDPSKNA
jgi:hypothetical protein